MGLLGYLNMKGIDVLSRFWGNAEDKKFRTLEVRGKPIALKNGKQKGVFED